MAKAKPEQMSLADYKASPKGKGSSRVRSPKAKTEKKATGGKAQMDLSEKPECKALEAVSINQKAQCASYEGCCIEYQLEGVWWRLKPPERIEK